METNRQPDDVRRAVGIAARVLGIVAWLVVFLLGVVAGVLFHSRYPVFWPRHTVQREETPPALQVTKTPPPTRAEPEQLLAALADCARNLAEKERELVRQAKEDRIAYQLLRARGYPADAPECERLVANQKRLNEAIAQISAELAEARRLETGLQKVLDERSTLPKDVTKREPLLREIRACVHKHKMALHERPVIPVEQWEGGPDRYMHTETE